MYFNTVSKQQLINSEIVKNVTITQNELPSSAFNLKLLLGVLWILFSVDFPLLRSTPLLSIMCVQKHKDFNFLVHYS